jgi:MFS family permease
VRTLTFRALAAALVVIAVVNAAVSAHAVPFLIERGYDAGVAAGVAGAVGAMQLVGRVLFGVAEGRVAAAWATVSVFLLQSLGLVSLASATSAAALVLFVVPYGMGHGMTTLVRAARLADFFGAAHYGAISGVLGFWSTGARALGPIAAGWLYTALGDYVLVFRLMVGAAALAAVAGWVAETSAARQRRKPA